MNRKMQTAIDQAIGNPVLGNALTRFREAYVVSRAKAYEGIDFTALKEQIAAARGHVADHLAEVTETFKKAAEARGAKVFVARSAQEARDYITALARDRGVRTVVKSKSMASEEIHLNEHLKKHGIQACETDLGEWIIHLAGQRPSHMVLPAIHMAKEEVSDLFSKEIGERLSTDIPRLVKVARNALREKFFEADMGISGANIAIAETGTLVLVTNEGNARLVCTLPKIHVALVGLEKLVPTYTDAAAILTALPRSATGQLLTSYVSMITGPTPTDDGTLKELHIVLMDNRRSDMARDEKFKQTFKCIRCASCLNVCPVYLLVGGHVFGHVYTGGIGTILTAWFNELKTADDLQALCIGCGRCKEICPGGIDIPGLILEIRRRLVEKEGLPFVYKAGLTLMKNRGLVHKLLWAAKLGQKPFARDGYIRHLPLFLAGLTEHRSLPTIAREPFSEVFKRIAQPACKEKAAFFTGCSIEFAFPRIGEAVVRTLNKAGIEVVLPAAQTCCGTAQRANGAFDLAAGCAVDNIKALAADTVDYVVVACASCMSSLKKEYPQLLKDTNHQDCVPDAEKLAAKTYDFSSLVKKLIHEKRLTPKTGHGHGKVTYHDSCHARRLVGTWREPRDIIQACGYELAEMYECDTCCGLGGTYTVKQSDLSMRMLKRKLKNIEDTGAQYVAMECPGCLVQIDGGLDQSGSKIKARHVAELLVDQF
ncbi:MAG: (Fe-S)-binding protein [Lentisphaerae bacterium RIFOXYB12_FULL_65_16]|nr:MAG: (Fe-S)-binding protein [Lentisphaerae bacterium RIFOXYA12_64_32]OGV84088.1 MAG: (Fe-S)-binding protein [Lentisphaerae bacterium RIFOXYB12_FULL_65_16]